MTFSPINPRLRSLVLWTGAALLGSSSISAATFDWRGPTNNDWMTGSNWRIGSIFQTTPPTASDSVTINNGGAPVLSGATATITGLAIGTYGGSLSIENAASLTSSYASVTGSVPSSITVTGAGSTWNNAGYLRLGSSDRTGTLVIANGGQVNANAGAGTLTLGYNATTATGIVRIGNGGAAGVLNAATVTSGTGSATLAFNHTNTAYFFTRTGATGGAGVAITGTTQVVFDAGVTHFAGSANTYSGDTTLNSGATFVFSSNDTASANSRLVLTGGTLAFGAGDFSQGTATLTGLGALAVAQNSIIDFANGNQLLHFAASAGESWSGTLAIHNWNADDRLFVGIANTALTNDQLARITFYSDAGTLVLGTGAWLGDEGRLTYSAIPEPSTFALLVGSFSLLACGLRRRAR